MRKILSPEVVPAPPRGRAEDLARAGELLQGLLETASALNWRLKSCKNILKQFGDLVTPSGSGV